MDGVEGHQWTNARPSLSCGVTVDFCRQFGNDRFILRWERLILAARDETRIYSFKATLGRSQS